MPLALVDALRPRHDGHPGFPGWPRATSRRPRGTDARRVGCSALGSGAADTPPSIAARSRETWPSRSRPRPPEPEHTPLPQSRGRQPSKPAPRSGATSRPAVSSRVMACARRPGGRGPRGGGVPAHHPRWAPTVSRSGWSSNPIPPPASVVAAPGRPDAAPPPVRRARALSHDLPAREVALPPAFGKRPASLRVGTTPKVDKAVDMPVPQACSPRFPGRARGRRFPEREDPAARPPCGPAPRGACAARRRPRPRRR